MYSMYAAVVWFEYFKDDWTHKSSLTVLISGNSFLPDVCGLGGKIVTSLRNIAAPTCELPKILKTITHEN